MNEDRPIGKAGAIAVAVLAVAVSTTAVPAQWPQWGGPNRNFVVEAEGLADTWPEEGPKQLWKKRLGGGYSSVVVDAGVLYTMYRKTSRDETEYTAALDARSGKVLWEHGYPSPIPEPDTSYPGPHATPLVVGSRLYTVGINGLMQCLDKNDGRVLWTHDLLNEFGASLPHWGYSCSPIAYQNLVVVPVGNAGNDEQHRQGQGHWQEAPRQATSEGQALVAFEQTTGAVAWKSLDFTLGHASPLLISFEGEDQLIQYTRSGMFAVAPDSGRLLWHYPVSIEFVSEVTVLPVWDGVDRLFFSTGEHATAIKLRRKDDQTSAVELWSNRKAPMGYGSIMKVGELLVGGKHGRTSAVVAVHAQTGKRMWVQRGLTCACFLSAGGKLIGLDMNGWLFLATATDEGMIIHSRTKIGEPRTHAVPTLVGTILYVRSRQDIMAFDLG